MKVSNENEKYNKESNSEILGITKYNDELIEKEKKYMQIKNDIINILLEHEQINKHLDTKYYVDKFYCNTTFYFIDANGNCLVPEYKPKK